MMVVFEIWGPVSVFSSGSTAQTLLFPSTSRYTPSIERWDGVSSAAASARSVSRISVAEVVFSDSDGSDGSPAGGCCGSGSAACMRNMRARERKEMAGIARPLNEEEGKHVHERREVEVKRRAEGETAKAAVV